MAGPKKSDMAANCGFEVKLWIMADELCTNMGAAECRHVILGLIFPKSITDPFHRTFYASLRFNGTSRTLSRCAIQLTSPHS